MHPSKNEPFFLIRSSTQTVEEYTVQANAICAIAEKFGWRVYRRGGGTAYYHSLEFSNHRAHLVWDGHYLYLLSDSVAPHTTTKKEFTFEEIVLAITGYGINLLPCPFCGKNAITFKPDAQNNIVSCSLGHAPMRSIEAWNTRTS